MYIANKLIIFMKRKRSESGESQNNEINSIDELLNNPIDAKNIDEFKKLYAEETENVSNNKFKEALNQKLMTMCIGQNFNEGVKFLLTKGHTINKKLNLKLALEQDDNTIFKTLWNYYNHSNIHRLDEKAITEILDTVLSKKDIDSFGTICTVGDKTAYILQSIINSTSFQKILEKDMTFVYTIVKSMIHHNYKDMIKECLNQISSYSIKNYQNQLFNFVIQNKNHYNPNVYDLFCEAAESQNKYVMNYLINDKINPVIPAQVGSKVWIKAIENQNEDFILYLLARGVNINAPQNKTKSTIYHIIAKDADKLTFLLDTLKKYNIYIHLEDFRNSSGENPFLYSLSKNQNIDNIKKLLDLGFKLDTCNNSQQNSLYYAAHYKIAKLTDMYIKSNLNINF